MNRSRHRPENRFAPEDFSRRRFLSTAAALAAGALARSSFGDERDWSGQRPVRYPDPDIKALDPRFNKYRLGNTAIQRLHTGMLWAEGPAWNGVGRYLLWSDIPNNIQLRRLEEDGHVSVFRNPAGTLIKPVDRPAPSVTPKEAIESVESGTNL